MNNTLRLSIIPAGALRIGDEISPFNGYISSIQQQPESDELIITFKTGNFTTPSASSNPETRTSPAFFDFTATAKLASDLPCKLVKSREMTTLDYPELVLSSLSILETINVTGGIFDTEMDTGLVADPSWYDLAKSAQWLCESLRKHGVREACLLIDNEAAPTYGDGGDADYENDE